MHALHAAGAGVGAGVPSCDQRVASCDQQVSLKQPSNSERAPCLQVASCDQDAKGLPVYPPAQTIRFSSPTLCAAWPAHCRHMKGATMSMSARQQLMLAPRLTSSEMDRCANKEGQIDFAAFEKVMKKAPTLEKVAPTLEKAAPTLEKVASTSEEKK